MTPPGDRESDRRRARPASDGAGHGRSALTERGMAFVGSTEFTRGRRSRVTRRGVRPARTGRPRRRRPHRSRSGAGVGVGQVVAAQSHVGRRPGARRPRSGRRLGRIHPGTDRQVAPRPDHLTLVVVDEAAWWRDRAAPIRTVMSDASRPVQVRRAGRALQRRSELCAPRWSPNSLVIWHASSGCVNGGWSTTSSCSSSGPPPRR